MVEVTEVPMLAPMMRLIACFTVSSSAATIVMKMEVEVEDDCTSTVTSTPTSMPATGLLKTSEFAKTSPACLPATRRKPVAMKDNAQMKK